MMETRSERREQKRNKKWYKKHLHNNRKALEILIELQRKEIRNHEQKH